MVDLSLNRVSRTTLKNPDLNNIKNAMQGAKEGTFVRAKQDGAGEKVIYGHKSGFRSLFNRANPEREQEGTRLVAQAIRNFASDKSPQTRELAENLLARFCDAEGRVGTRMTNTEIIDIIDQVELSAKSTALTNFTGEIEDGHNLTNTFFHHMASIEKLVQVASTSGSVAEPWKSVCKPELFVGLILALPDNLTADNGKNYDFGKLQYTNVQIGTPYTDELTKATSEFKSFFMTDEELKLANKPNKFMNAQQEIEYIENDVKIVKKDISKSENLDNFLSDYCNNIKDRFFCATSFEEWATDYNRKLVEDDDIKQQNKQVKQYKDEDPEAKAKRLNFVTSPNDKRAPIFLNEEAQAKLEGFDEATGADKLEMLRDAFAVHMTTPSNLEVPSDKTWTEGERTGVETRQKFQTPAEALVSGLRQLHSVLY